MGVAMAPKNKVAVQQIASTPQLRFGKTYMKLVVSLTLVRHISALSSLATLARLACGIVCVGVFISARQAPI